MARGMDIMSDNAPAAMIEDIPQAPDICLIRLRGDLDIRSAAILDSCLTESVMDGKKFAIVDLSAVTMIASVALGKLLGLKRRFSEKGGDLVLSGINIEIKMKCLLMGVDKIFKMFSDVHSAMNVYSWEVMHQAESIKLSFPPQIGVVPAVRRFVSGVMAQKGYKGRDSFRIETIVDELCNNAVEYGSKNENDNISLSMRIDWEKIELDAENVSDPAKREQLQAFMSNVSCEMPHDGDFRRGRGLALVKLLSSDFSADVTEKGTIVHVTKIKEE
jgi:anti-anti-sigma factor